MTNKFTSGPWVVRGSIDARYLNGIGDVTAIRCGAPSDDRYVALATLDAMGSDRHIETTPEEREANAALIAAAPVMYETLAWIRDYIGAHDADIALSKITSRINAALAPVES